MFLEEKLCNSGLNAGKPLILRHVAGFSLCFFGAGCSTWNNLGEELSALRSMFHVEH